MNSNKQTKKYLTLLELQHPENLNKEWLLSLLKERYIGNKSVKDLDRVDLIELYHEIIQPYPQRDYCKNRRGILLSKAREERANEQANKEAADPMQSSGTTIHVVTPTKRKLEDIEGCKRDRKISFTNNSVSKSPSEKSKDGHNLNGTIKPEKLLDNKSNDVKKPSKRTASIDSEGSDNDMKKHKKITWP